tara:strand:+ start:5232 stop:6281 length:1050 start_codon:yes stop_codon:yes gene_type:complete
MIRKKSKSNHNLTYKKSGVSINEANRMISKISPQIKKTFDKNVLSSIGSFAALYDISKIKYKNPVLVSGTDGVGTKLKTAIKLKKLDTIGIDLVAMCVNDVICLGAKPLFFLDYYATGKLKSGVASKIIRGIIKGCKKSSVSLIGGETAEMPNVYKNNDFDIAGFCVGISEKRKLLPKKNIKHGDIIIGLESSGLHSNGYSLVNHMLDKGIIKLSHKVKNRSLKNIILKPTTLYTDVLSIKSFDKVKAIANITGGGLTENIPRVIPKGMAAEINLDINNLPPLFSYIKDRGNIKPIEMLKTFNCGIGMILILDKKDLNVITNEIKRMKFKYKIIGKVVRSKIKKIKYIL